jgi:hypothetical protein
MTRNARKLLSIAAASALVAFPGCATDDAVKKDAKKAEPKAEKAAADAEQAGSKAVDAIDDNDSK